MLSKVATVHTFWYVTPVGIEPTTLVLLVPRAYDLSNVQDHYNTYSKYNTIQDYNPGGRCMMSVPPSFRPRMRHAMTSVQTYCTSGLNSPQQKVFPQVHEQRGCFLGCR